MRFYGNEICCGSYACLNAMRDAKVDLQLFEMSTSAPFGIRHFENAQFDRLLTTFCDPNKGIDFALKLWGYKAERYDMHTSEETVEILKELLRDSRAVLGPIDMGSLGYQLFPQILKRMDHFIALEYWSEDKILCYDSEGYCGHAIDYEKLQEYISVKELYEAEGKITIRFIRCKNKEVCIEEILKAICSLAFRNLKKAEEEGQGSGAIMWCYDFLKEQDMYLWKLSLLYDIQYLMQRKCLMKVFSGLYRNTFRENKKMCEEIDHIVEKQIELSGQIYEDLKLESRIDKEYFVKLGRCEKELADLGEYL